MSKNKKHTLYKYRDLKDFRFFIDIILNNRLYAAAYTNLNDPMEGYYRYISKELTKEILEQIREDKKQLTICSLSSENDIELMWSHYCDGHRGVVIGIEIDPDDYDVKSIIYKGLPNVTKTETTHINSIEIAKSILTNKQSIWSYEKEVRAFVKDGNFINVKVTELILGNRMDSTTQEFIRPLLKLLTFNHRYLS